MESGEVQDTGRQQESKSQISASSSEQVAAPGRVGMVLEEEQHEQRCRDRSRQSLSRET